MDNLIKTVGLSFKRIDENQRFYIVKHKKVPEMGSSKQAIEFTFN